ncbi:MAG: thermonuclease family protein [Alphaproteobacteria bacterium]|nr:thermonuclease family protein [Alphaproteobacteria bacterium]
MTSASHGRGQAGRSRACRVLALAVLAAGLAWPAGAGTISGEARVIDGDTLAVAGRRIRLHGIDAPETRQTCLRHGRRWACGKAATRAMRRLVGRDPVRCEVRARDRYGRSVAACFAAGRDLQRELVRQGLALAYRRYSVRYVPDEDAARRERAGLWSGEFTEPWRWRRQQRRERPQSGNPAPKAGACLIKGNISRNGRIYHVPGGKHYDRTRIDEARGERWFCTEAEARAAGWRRARR